LQATEFFYPRTVTWASGVNVAVVEIEAETGRLSILKYVFVHDCGLPINPTIVEGQIYGGFTQGLSLATGERLAFDAEGQVQSGSLMDYYVPRAGDVPRLELAHLTFLTSDNPLGIKSVGESGPNSPPAAIAAAIEDALGHRVAFDQIPITTSDVLAAMRHA
jgi:carbon-monoxide dehydrogenase large subunit